MQEPHPVANQGLLAPRARQHGDAPCVTPCLHTIPPAPCFCNTVFRSQIERGWVSPNSVLAGWSNECCTCPSHPTRSTTLRITVCRLPPRICPHPSHQLDLLLGSSNLKMTKNQVSVQHRYRWATQRRQGEGRARMVLDGNNESSFGRKKS